jgi:hypothetical protein
VKKWFLGLDQSGIEVHTNGITDPVALLGLAIPAEDGRIQPLAYLLNQSTVRCQARSAAALL